MTKQTEITRGYRVWFLLDGVVTGVNAAAYLILHRWLDDLLGASTTTYLVVGAVLCAFTLALVTVALSPRPLVGLAYLLVALNVVWSLGSFAVATANPFGFNGWGLAWVVIQAVVVLAFAVLQAGSLNRHTRA